MFVLDQYVSWYQFALIHEYKNSILVIIATNFSSYEGTCCQSSIYSQHFFFFGAVLACEMLAF